MKYKDNTGLPGGKAPADSGKYKDAAEGLPDAKKLPNAQPCCSDPKPFGNLK